MKILSEIRLPARIENMPEAVSAVAAAALNTGIHPDRVSFLQVAVEEAVVNICSYSYPEGDGDFDIRCLDDDGVFVTEIVNHGIPFDVLTVPDPDVTAALDDRPEGGLGIFFMKRFVDEAGYRREAGRNILTLRVRPGHTAPS